MTYLAGTSSATLGGKVERYILTLGILWAGGEPADVIDAASRRKYRKDLWGFSLRGWNGDIVCHPVS